MNKSIREKEGKWELHGFFAVFHSPKAFRLSLCNFFWLNFFCAPLLFMGNFAFKLKKSNLSIFCFFIYLFFFLIACQTDATSSMDLLKIADLEKEIIALRQENQALRQELKRKLFTAEMVVDNDDFTRFYTGLPKYSVI